MEKFREQLLRDPFSGRLDDNDDECVKTKIHEAVFFSTVIFFNWT